MQPNFTPDENMRNSEPSSAGDISALWYNVRQITELFATISEPIFRARKASDRGLGHNNIAMLSVAPAGLPSSWQCATPRLVIRLCRRSAHRSQRAANSEPPWGDRSIAGGKPVLAGVAPGKTEKDIQAPIVGDRGHGYNTSRCFLSPTTGL